MGDLDLTELRRQIEALETAIAPFAAAAWLCDGDPDDRVVSLGRWHTVGTGVSVDAPSRTFFSGDVRLTVGDLRRAKAAFERGLSDA